MNTFRMMALFAALTFLSNPAASADVQRSSDQLFSMDVAKGWRWDEKPGQVTVVNPSEKNGIAIIWGKANITSDEEIPSRLDNAVTVMKQKLENRNKNEKPKISSKKTKVDGAEARTIDFTTETPKGTNNATQYFVVHEGNSFSITYGSNEKDEKKAMDKMVGSLKFKKKK